MRSLKCLFFEEENCETTTNAFPKTASPPLTETRAASRRAYVDALFDAHEFAQRERARDARREARHLRR